MIMEEEKQYDSESLAKSKDQQAKAEGTAPDEQKKLPFFAIAGAFLLTAFIIPYALTFRMASSPYNPGVATRSEPASRTIENATTEAARSGLMGALVAAFILLIWKMDALAFARDKELDNSKWITLLTCLLIFVLWTAWTSTGYILIRVNDEISDQPPCLPGIPRTN